MLATRVLGKNPKTGRQETVKKRVMLATRALGKNTKTSKLADQTAIRREMLATRALGKTLQTYQAIIPLYYHHQLCVYYSALSVPPDHFTASTRLYSTYADISMFSSSYCLYMLPSCFISVSHAYAAPFLLESPLMIHACMSQYCIDSFDSFCY